VAVFSSFLQKIFDTVPLGWTQWEIIFPLLLGPSLAAELTKIVLRKKNSAD
jgi:hypothetical protein